MVTQEDVTGREEILCPDQAEDMVQQYAHVTRLILAQEIHGVPVQGDASRLMDREGAGGLLDSPGEQR